MVDATLRIAYAAFAIGTLGFLGLGTPPPDPDWGGMVNQGVKWLSVSAWMTAVPAIALSGFGSERDKRTSVAAGFSAHLTKPVTIARLSEAIREVLPEAARRRDQAG